jgi:hypothetical protein
MVAPVVYAAPLPPEYGIVPVAAKAAPALAFAETEPLPQAMAEMDAVVVVVPPPVTVPVESLEQDAADNIIMATGIKIL